MPTSLIQPNVQPDGVPETASRAASRPERQLSEQPLRFLNAYWSVWQALSVPLSSELERLHGLDLRAFIALSYVQGGVTSPSELALKVGIPRYEISRTLERLSHLGAISRISHPTNARRRSLSATPQGQALWAAALGSVQQLIQPRLPALTTLEQLSVQLEQLAALSTDGKNSKEQ